LGDDFNLREFLDEYLEAGMIPMSLTRWDMMGYDDEIKDLLNYCPPNSPMNSFYLVFVINSEHIIERMVVCS